MGMKQEQVGGGAATPVANEFANFLLSGLQNGFGSVGGQNTAGTAMARVNMGEVIGSLLAGGNGAAANAARQSLDHKAADLRERYSIAGTGLGTPASSAEARLYAEGLPQIDAIAQQQQIQALGMLLPMIQQMVGIGMPQAQMIQTPNFGMNLMNGIIGGAGAVAPFFMPGMPFGSNGKEGNG